jgi:hypothetical protein
MIPSGYPVEQLVIPSGYPVEQLAKTLCWEDRSAHIRAIALFALKVYAVGEGGLPSSFNRAKVFAAVAMLEHLERFSADDLPLEQRMLLPGYKELLNIALRHGWTTIRRLESTSKYQQDLAARVEGSIMIAEMVEFSYRYATKRADHRKAGFTMARDFLCKKNKKFIGYSRSTITERWSAFNQGTSAVLIYLMHHPKFNLLSATPTADDFWMALLKQVEDRELLKQFFAAYIAVSKILRPHGYDNVKISLPELKGIPLPFDIDDFSEEDVKIIDSVKSGSACTAGLS